MDQNFNPTFVDKIPNDIPSARACAISLMHLVEEKQRSTKASGNRFLVSDFLLRNLWCRQILPEFVNEVND